MALDYKFTSDTDSEVIAHLIHAKLTKRQNRFSVSCARSNKRSSMGLLPWELYTKKNHR